MKNLTAEQIKTDSKRLTSKIQHCSECETKIQPIWKGSINDPETWFWLECEKCEDLICDLCSVDVNGEIYCMSCYSENKNKKEK